MQIFKQFLGSVKSVTKNEGPGPRFLCPTGSTLLHTLIDKSKVLSFVRFILY
jgi:hypothetical protein